MDTTVELHIEPASDGTSLAEEVTGRLRAGAERTGARSEEIVAFHDESSQQLIKGIERLDAKLQEQLTTPISRPPEIRWRPGDPATASVDLDPKRNAALADRLPADLRELWLGDPENSPQRPGPREMPPVRISKEVAPAWESFRAPYQGRSLRRWGGFKTYGEDPQIVASPVGDPADGMIDASSLVVCNNSGIKTIAAVGLRGGVGVLYRLREKGHVQAIAELEVISATRESESETAGLSKAVVIQENSIDMTVNGHRYGDASIVRFDQFFTVTKGWHHDHTTHVFLTPGSRMQILFEETTYYPKGAWVYVDIGVTGEQLCKRTFSSALVGWNAFTLRLRSLRVQTVAGGVLLEDQQVVVPAIGPTTASSS